MAGDVRERPDVGVVALPAMPIAATEASGADGDDDAVWLQLWRSNILNGNLGTEMVIDNCSQLMPTLVVASCPRVRCGIHTAEF